MAEAYGKIFKQLDEGTGDTKYWRMAELSDNFATGHTEVELEDIDGEEELFFNEPVMLAFNTFRKLIEKAKTSLNCRIENLGWHQKLGHNLVTIFNVQIELYFVELFKWTLFDPDEGVNSAIQGSLGLIIFILLFNTF